MTWNKTINVAGAGVRGVGATYTEPSTGAYKVKITKTEPHEKDGVVSSIRFSTSVVGTEFEGTDIRIFIGLDDTKEGNRKSWRTALLSAGYIPAQIDAGEVEMGPDTFESKIAYLYYKAKDANDATSQSDRRFITPEAYASLMGTVAETTDAPGKTATKSTVPSVTVAAKPAGAGGLRAMLGK